MELFSHGARPIRPTRGRRLPRGRETRRRGAIWAAWRPPLILHLLVGIAAFAGLADARASEFSERQRQALVAASGFASTELLAAIETAGWAPVLRPCQHRIWTDAWRDRATGGAGQTRDKGSRARAL